MSAHLLTIHAPKCATCGTKATVTLRNTWNVEIGDYCGRHGREALQRQLAIERGDEVRR
jgi:hypothetical protein